MNALRKIAGMYVDVVVLLIGGILQLVNGIKATPVNTDDIVWGILKLTVLEGAGLAAAIFLLVVPGCVLVGWKSGRR